MIHDHYLISFNNNNFTIQLHREKKSSPTALSMEVLIAFVLKNEKKTIFYKLVKFRIFIFLLHDKYCQNWSKNISCMNIIKWRKFQNSKDNIHLYKNILKFIHSKTIEMSWHFFYSNPMPILSWFPQEHW